MTEIGQHPCARCGHPQRHHHVLPLERPETAEGYEVNLFDCAIYLLPKSIPQDELHRAALEEQDELRHRRPTGIPWLKC